MEMIEYTTEVARDLEGHPDLYFCYMVIKKWGISFSPFKQFVAEFLKEDIKHTNAPEFFVKENVLVYVYKNRLFSRIGPADMAQMMRSLMDACVVRGIKKLVLPLKPLIMEVPKPEIVMEIIENTDSRGVDLYVF